MAAVAFAIGAILGAGHHQPAAKSLAERFVRAWSRQDFEAMYEEVDARSQRALTPSRFAADYRRAMATATATGIAVAGHARRGERGSWAIPVRIGTRLWGTLRESVHLKVAGGPQGPRVSWSRTLVFPGLEQGERLSRRTELPARASLLARDGTLLAGGQAASAGQRESPLGLAALAAVGEVGPVSSLPAARRAQLEAQGVPADAIVGTSGLERALDDSLRGAAGGELLAGERVLASAPSRPAAAVRTTISPTVQRAVATALGGLLGGIVALDPASGQVLGVAGIGLDSVQPPGSTFKMVTVTGVLEAKLASPATVFPYATSTTLDGVKLENANGESCGGTLAAAFASSCNSVFAPLGVRLGAARLVNTAERLGFNQAPSLAGAAQSTIPPASQIQGELALGSTAIGQGQVQASALEMATVAATIADGGRRPAATFDPDRSTPPVRAIDPAVARTVRQLMIGVVRSGTGTAAAIPGVTVAGKTGTAELGKPHCGGGEAGEAASQSSGSEAAGEETSKAGAEGCRGAAKDPRNTDAWFAAFAPAIHAKIAVGVLLVRDGAGGETAAPVAREVLEAGLR